MDVYTDVYTSVRSSTSNTIMQDLSSDGASLLSIIGATTSHDTCLVEGQDVDHEKWWQALQNLRGGVGGQ